MIKKAKDIEKDLQFIAEHGNPKGSSTGFESFDEFYTIKYGSYTIILAEPHSGKSEFGFELCLGQSEKYGKKTLVYSPETGTVADIYAELMHKYIGKPIQRSLPYSASDEEYYRALNYIDSHFSIIDTDERGLTYHDIMSLRTDEDLIFVDPNNEVIHNYVDRQDTYIENITADIRRFCKKNNVHMIITMHPAKQDVTIDKDTGKRYFAMPKARMAAGGQAWFRKAMGWINLWRPVDGILDVDGLPYGENAVLVEVEKAKPKGIGKKGTCVLYWDFKKNRYFEKSLDEQSFYYSFEHEKGKGFAPPSALQPSKEFDLF